MDSKLNKKKCSHHKDQYFSFYCFDDKLFLCSKCFKEHKKHNIEIVDDLREKSLFFKTLKKMGISLTEYYLKIQKILQKTKDEIEEALSTINKKLEELKQCAPPGEITNVFSLTYNEYEKISIISEILKQTHQMSYNLGELTKEIKLNHAYTNFKTINKEVKILEHSKEYPAHPIEVMLGKKSNVDYSLFDGMNNHFITVDLGEYCFLKKIKIAVDNFDCSLKNFKVQIKNEIGIWEGAGKFICAQFKLNPNIQEFIINRETQFVKIDLIDNWGAQSGNFIMVKSLSFEVGDIL